MIKVNYGIHHQAAADCPECQELVVVDLGEDDMAEDMDVTCPQCGTEFVLGEAM